MRALMLATILAIAAAAARAEVTPQHPLDPLSRAELTTAVAVLKAADHVGPATRFTFIKLAEPPKAAVRAWHPGAPLTRKAFVMLGEGPQTYEAVVDLGASKLESWRKVEGVQPSILLEETQNLNDVLRADEGWQAAMRKRGIEQFDKIQCMPFSAGYFAVPEEEGHRLIRSECYDGRATPNYWSQPIEGVVATVDLNAKRVVKLIDTGVVPIPPAAEYDPDATANAAGGSATSAVVAKPVADIAINGSEVTWQNWRFRVRMDPRLGIVISTVGINDQGKLRAVMYEGHLSEIFVPYMDPTPGWYFRTYMDAGEYGAGKLASSLVPGGDCPADAVFLSDWLADGHGVPQERPRIICIFERTTGEIAWRHYDFISDRTVSIPGRELVVRWIATVGNYDYVFDWKFAPSGTIRIAIGATGIDEVKGVAAERYGDGPNPDAAYGTFIASHTVGTNHDHFFCFKLDLDIDGTRNSFETARLKKVRLDGDSLRKSLWVVQPTTAKVETQAKLGEDMEQPSLWRVINPGVKDASGYPVGYQLIPGHVTEDMLDPDDHPRERAGFADHELWVTPYTPDQAAAGLYPNQSKGGDGLPRWTKQNRSIADTDIVLWYTIGFHHAPLPEDWPVLPTMWHEFMLKPSGFFDHNPTIAPAPPKGAVAHN